MNKSVFTSIKLSTILITAGIAAQAHASGYHFGAQSVSALSTANTNAAEAADPSTIFYNPAGLTELSGTQVTGNLFLVKPDVKYNNAEARYADGTEVKGQSNGKIASDVTAVPQLYASHQLNDRVTLGLGVYVPFASETDYDDDAVLRYNVNETSVKSIDINPTIAFKINENHSIGVGVIAQYFDAKLVKFADFTPIAGAGAVSTAAQVAATNPGALTQEQQAIVGQVQNLVPTLVPKYMALGQSQADAVNSAKAEAGNIVAAGVTKQLHAAGKNYDGRATVKGDDWGFGYNLGWLWKINDSWRVGLNYRSKVSHTLSGEAKWDMVGADFASQQGQVLSKIIQSPISSASPLGGVGYVKSEGATVKVVTPESLSFHTMWKASPKWNLFGNAAWTRHSRFDQLDINLANDKFVSNPSGKTNTSTMITNWRDTYSFGLGASYQQNEQLQWRFGVNYDRSPVRDASHRLPTMPDNNRTLFAVGAKYDINPQSSLNFAYAYMHVQDAELIAEGPKVVNVDSHVKGYAKTKSSANILGVQYTYKF